MAPILNTLLVFSVLNACSLRAVLAMGCSQVLYSRYHSYFNDLNMTLESRRIANKEGGVTYDEVKDLYFPSCEPDTGHFAMKQCFNNKYCWCSDPRGNLIEGTFQNGTEAYIDCTQCRVGNESYNSGQYFFHQEECKACKCQGGIKICQKYFCSDKTTLSQEDIKQLKLTIARIVYIQYEHFQYTGIIASVTEQNLAEVPLDLALANRVHRLRWTFDVFDTNDDDTLGKDFEFDEFMKEIHRFITSRQAHDVLFSNMDQNSDGLLFKDEWLQFFYIADDEIAEGASTLDNDDVSSGDTAPTRSSRSLPEVMKEFVRKLRKQQRMHSKNKYISK